MNEQFKAIFNQIPGSLLETSRFGRSESHAYWINSGSLFECAKRIRSDAGMNWLENLSCIQVDQSLVMTYFVRASFDLPLSSPTAHGEDVLWVSAPSVSEVWPIAAEFEVEIARLFGVRFQRQEGLPAHESAAPDVSWNGFPLRKDFVFPDAERAGGFR
jgi:Ni,Fe-hydrogenase III component G